MSTIHVFETTIDDPDQLERINIHVETLDDVSTKIAHGTYAVFRTYPGGTTFRLERHLNRMRSSAQMLESPFPATNSQLREAIAQAYQLAAFPLARVKLTVPYDDPNKILLALEAFQPPPLPYYKQGVQVALVPYARQAAKAKDSRFIEKRDDMKTGLDADTYEVMWHDDHGYILEGSSTNFYAVMGNTLYTAGSGILEGISRSVLLEVAERFLDVRLEALHIDQLPLIEEAMLTSSSRGVMPIVKVGEHAVGTSHIGPYYQRLAAAYHDQIERELESLRPTQE